MPSRLRRWRADDQPGVPAPPASPGDAGRR
jgi:hypothetical protein